MMQGQARSRSVLMGLENHMITSAVPALLPGPRAGHDATSQARRVNRTDPLHAMPLPHVRSDFAVMPRSVATGF